MQDKTQEIVEMRICQVPYLLLYPNVLYRLTVDLTCAKCMEAAKKAGDYNGL